ncbi:MAG: PRC-barrel domain-containing protein [Cyanobacteriota bacterium]|nr:PRC-barrel domain-containing protein [Cyanobacteriota bacterium]
MFGSQLVLKQSELLNRLVLDRHTAEQVGRVSTLLMDPQAQRVVGLVCKSGLLAGQKHTYTWSQVYSIGQDGILVGDLEERVADAPKPVEPPIGSEIWTDGADKVGKLVDFLFQPQTGAVVGYLYSSSGWRGILDGVYLLQPIALSSVGRKRIIVLEAALQSPQQYSKGWGDRLDRLTEFLKEDYERTKRDVDAVKHNTQNALEQVKDAAQNTTDKLQTTVSDVTEKVRENPKLPFSSDRPEESENPSDRP